MKSMHWLVVAVALLLAAAPPNSSPTEGNPNKRELRQPGFIFLELGTEHIADYVEYFQTVLGYELIDQQPGFAELESDRGQLLLMDPRGWPAGHPFYKKLTGSGQGLGVEIGLVVADLDKTYAAAAKFKDWKVSTGIVRRPWGVRDFRVLSPDGYYLRFTEGPTK